MHFVINIPLEFQRAGHRVIPNGKVGLKSG